jgi:hypothetical protein
MIFVEGSCSVFPSNFGILDENLEGILDHKGSWEIGSFVNREKLGKSSVSRKGNDTS